MNKELKALRTLGYIVVEEKYTNEKPSKSDLKTMFKTQYNIIEKALKRNKAMKPKYYGSDIHFCPSCLLVINQIMNLHYCGECGQRLDWGENNEL